MNIHSFLQHEWDQLSYWYGIATGILLGIGFVVPILWWVGVIGIVLLFRLTQLTSPNQKIVELGVVVWFVKSLFVLSWYISTYPVGWIGPLPFWFQVGVIGGYWFISAFAIAVGGGVFTLLAAYLYRAPMVPRFAWYLIVPFIWLFAEVFSAYFFSIYTLGPGSFIQGYFSFGMMGYLFVETWLGIQLASVAGVYGLSFVMALFASACTYVFVQKSRSGSMLICIVIVLLGLFSHFIAIPQSTSSERSLGVTLIGIDTDFPAGMIDSAEGVTKKSAVTETAVDAAFALHPEYVLLPEESRLLVTTYAGFTPREAYDRFLFTHQNSTTSLIDTGRVETEGGEAFLRATIFDGKSKEVYQFDKQYLVPQGEYVPYFSESTLRLIGQGSIADRIERDESYRPGPLTRTNRVDTPAYLPGILFCFESVRPNGINALTRTMRPPFVVHPLSHSWFHEPKGLWHQLDTMLIIQARSSGIPIVSAGNMVDGKLYLPNGHIESGEVIQSGDMWRLRKFTF